MYQEWKTDDIAEAVHGAAEEWFTGYTNHLEDGHQRKIVLVSREDEANDRGYRVYEITPLDDHGRPDHEQAALYKVTVAVEKIDG